MRVADYGLAGAKHQQSIGRNRLAQSIKRPPARIRREIEQEIAA